MTAWDFVREVLLFGKCCAFSLGVVVNNEA